MSGSESNSKRRSRKPQTRKSTTVKSTFNKTQDRPRTNQQPYLGTYRQPKTNAPILFRQTYQPTKYNLPPKPMRPPVVKPPPIQIRHMPMVVTKVQMPGPPLPPEMLVECQGMGMPQNLPPVMAPPQTMEPPVQVPPPPPPPQQVAPVEQSTSSTEREQHNGTIIDFPNVNINEDVEIIKNSFGSNTLERVMINILTYRSQAQRLAIAHNYFQAYNRSLYQDVDTETAGNFKKVLLALLIPRLEFLAREVMDSIKGGLMLDSDCLTDVICPMTPRQVRELSAQYFTLYDKDVVKDVQSHLSGSFKKIISGLLTASRSEMPANEFTAQEDANAMKKAVGTILVDDDTFIRVFCESSYDQLRLTFQEYERITGTNIHDSVEKLFSGDSRKAYSAILLCMKDPIEFYTTRLHKALTGLITNDRAVTRIIVSRSEIDLLLIKDAFLKTYNRSLEDAIVSSTIGSFKEILLRIVAGNRSVI